MSPVRVMRIPRSSGWFQPMTGVWHVTGDSRAADATASPSAASPSRSWRCWPGSPESRSGRRTLPSGGSGSASSHVRALQVAETSATELAAATTVSTRLRAVSRASTRLDRLPASASVRAARAGARRRARRSRPAAPPRLRGAHSDWRTPAPRAALQRISADGARRGRDRARQPAASAGSRLEDSRSPRSRRGSCCSGRC